MCEELEDFEYFMRNQLYRVDFYTGELDTIREVIHAKTGKPYKQRRLNVGSVNSDGYTRVWCNGSLRMKHRLLFWLYHGYLPEEVDHFNKNRSDNSISNLRPVNRAENVQGMTYAGRKRFTEEELHKICQLIASNSKSDQKIANIFSCSRIAIMGIRHKRRHKNIANLYF